MFMAIVFPGNEEFLELRGAIELFYKFCSEGDIVGGRKKEEYLKAAKLLGLDAVMSGTRPCSTFGDTMSSHVSAPTSEHSSDQGNQRNFIAKGAVRSSRPSSANQQSEEEAEAPNQQSADQNRITDDVLRRHIDGAVINLILIELFLHFENFSSVHCFRYLHVLNCQMYRI